MAIPNESPLLKILENGAWAYPGTLQFFGYPQTSNLASTFTGPIRMKAHKNFGEKGAWAYPGLPNFWVPQYCRRNG